MSADRPCAIERPGYSFASNNRTKRKSKPRNAIKNKANDLRKSSPCARGRYDFDKDSFWNDRINNAAQNIVLHDSSQNPQDSVMESAMGNNVDSGKPGQTPAPENGSRRVSDDCPKPCRYEC